MEKFVEGLAVLVMFLFVAGTALKAFPTNLSFAMLNIADLFLAAGFLTLGAVVYALVS